MDIGNFLPDNQSTGGDLVPDMSGFGSGLLGLTGGLFTMFCQRPQYIINSTQGRLEFQSMLEMSSEESTNLPTESIEKGSFANYNRIVEPIELRCRLAYQGYPSQIQSAIETLKTLKNGMDTVTFITPFETYENFMLESFDYRRDNHTGHNVLIADLRLKELREVETQKTTSSVNEPPPKEVSESASADGSCASAVDGGEVQTYEPSAVESSSASDESSGGGGSSSILYDVIGQV
jgi:hypothetical protein